MVVKLMDKDGINLIIVNCGAFSFDNQKTANNITSDKKESAKIIKQLENPESEYSRLYKLGKDKAEYSIMNKLFGMAQSGDINALKEYDKRIRINHMQK